ncbi:TPA: macrolide ABC transporter ATP-binding protein [bacterium]|nr:macrolide ABC transporter ATP-binding protein [bacterium]
MVIQFDKISKVYPMGEKSVEALQEISLEVEEGEFLSIMGPSGSGKSTLMNIIGCLTRPTSGQYILEGLDISRLSSDELAKVRNKKVGFIFQAFNLLPRMDALENVALPLVYAGCTSKRQRELSGEILTSVGLADRMNHHPNKLSGGEQQRVAIARALVNNPSIILADEPTGNLDTKTGEEIMRIFKDMRQQGKTIILVTHDQSKAELADRIVYLRDGRIL